MRRLKIILTGLSLWILFANVWALDNSQYFNLPAGLPPLGKTPPKTVLVTEFFSLGCPHCYAEESALEAWLKNKPSNVVFQRIAVSFDNPNWLPLAKAYWVAKALHKEKTLVPALFKAIHAQGLNLSNTEALRSFFETQGIPGSTFDEYMHSFSIDLARRQADQAAQTYGIFGVPTFVVGNEYATDLEHADSPSQVFIIIDSLVKQVLQESVSVND